MRNGFYIFDKFLSPNVHLLITWFGSRVRYDTKARKMSQSNKDQTRLRFNDKSHGS